MKERDNAVLPGVSRTPMRAAIRSLAKEGQVILRPLRSLIVANPTLRDICDNDEPLARLELTSAAANAEIAGIRDLQPQPERGCDPLDLFEIDMRFHIAMAARAHNPSMAETHIACLSRLWRHSSCRPAGRARATRWCGSTAPSSRAGGPRPCCRALRN